MDFEVHIVNREQILSGGSRERTWKNWDTVLVSGLFCIGLEGKVL